METQYVLKFSGDKSLLEKVLSPLEESSTSFYVEGEDGYFYQKGNTVTLEWDPEKPPGWWIRNGITNQGDG